MTLLVDKKADESINANDLKLPETEDDVQSFMAVNNMLRVEISK